MTERETFVRHICERPDDDTARLVFADWLDEHGEGARARFVRWQCAGRFARPYPRVSYRRWFAPWWGGRTYWRHLRLGDEPPVQALVLMRVRGAADLAAAAEAVYVTRGFVHHMRLPLATYLRVAPVWFGSEPVTRVALSDRAPWTDPPGAPSGVWWWLNSGVYRAHGYDSGWFLPDYLWRLLDGYLPESSCALDRAYPTKAAAVDALSRACVAWGRARAGLPPLAPARSHSDGR